MCYDVMLNWIMISFHILAHGDVGVFIAIMTFILIVSLSIGYFILFSKWRDSLSSQVFAIISIGLGVAVWLDVGREENWLFSYYFFVCLGFIGTGCIRLAITLKKLFSA